MWLSLFSSLIDVHRWFGKRIGELELHHPTLPDRRDARLPFIGYRHSRISVSVRVWLEALAR
jgi:hypothetical protein